jgi:hypothetical protein
VNRHTVALCQRHPATAHQTGLSLRTRQQALESKSELDLPYRQGECSKSRAEEEEKGEQEEEEEEEKEEEIHRRSWDSS